MKKFSADKVIPCDPQANREVRNIIAYLHDCCNSDKFLLGCFDYTRNADDKARNYYDNIKKDFGVACGAYNTFYPRNVEKNCYYTQEANAKIIEKYNDGCIIMLHPQGLTSPDIMEKYPEENPDLYIRNFDATYEGRIPEVYENYRSYLKSLADGIEELQNAGVTLMLRTFVEFNNPNFRPTYSDYNCKEARPHFINVFRQYYDYIAKERGLHNIVWCYSPVGVRKWDDFYPGDDYVDVFAPTFYARGKEKCIDSMDMLLSRVKDSHLIKFTTHGKPIGFGEFGTGIDTETDELGDWADLMPGIRKWIPNWGFLFIWCVDCGLFVPDRSINGEKFIHDPDLITLTDVPDLKDGTY